MTNYPRPPAHLEPYVRVLGVAGAMEFFMTFGGAELYLTTEPKNRSKLISAIGREKALALAEAVPALKVRIPTAKPWIALCLKTEGRTAADIARQLHVSDVAVRGWIKRGEPIERKLDDRQLRLF